MDLILWRHAEAHDAAPGESDLDRALTARGERQAGQMATWLNRHLPESTRILVSPALRTRQTAAALGRTTRLVDALAPGATPRQLLVAAHWPDSPDAVLLVGHQPTLGQLAAQLVGGELARRSPAWSMRKGAVWWLRQRERHGEAEVTLVAVLTPELL
jgi:phosphohistidine phosphatase